MLFRTYSNQSRISNRTVIQVVGLFLNIRSYLNHMDMVYNRPIAKFYVDEVLSRSA